MNRKLRCLIVDDEPIGIELIKAYIDKLPYLQLAGWYEDAPSAIGFLQENDVDILFSDIQMPETNGLDMVNTLPNPPLTIFISAHRDFAPEGFDTEAVDYLVKPVTFQRFEKAVNKARNFIRLRLEAEKNIHADDPFLFVKSDSGFLKVLYEDIIYFQAKGDYVLVVTRQEKDILWRITMLEVENKIHSNHFVRVHRSYVVNINRIVSVHRGLLELMNHIKIPFSKSYKPEVSRRIGIDDTVK
jgi:DNA-binding LytR/AlgR family response regulator